LLLSATQLAKKIRQRELTSVEVLQTYIDRIKKVNSEMLLQNSIPERPIGQIRAFLLKLAHSISLLKFGNNARDLLIDEDDNEVTIKWSLFCSR